LIASPQSIGSPFCSLAHFLEHMLFLGTEKYPTENEYSQYLNSHGGYSNAYTAQEDTVYYFDVQSDFFEGALDIFSSFFTCPIFTESATSRELNAVDSENTKNLQSDMWRSWQVLKNMARNGHPFSYFSTGNLETLSKLPESQGLNIRNLVINFYNQYYSANIMKLVVYGKESLDILQQWVETKFSSVPNKNVPLFQVPHDAFGEEQAMRYLEIVPIKDVKLIEIYFPIPKILDFYRSKPYRFLRIIV
jgi:insulysin